MHSAKKSVKGFILRWTVETSLKPNQSAMLPIRRVTKIMVEWNCIHVMQNELRDE